MASSNNGPNAANTEENNSGRESAVDLAQAFQDLARGEKTAQTLESSLTSLEEKIDDLLKSFENTEAVKRLDAQAEMNNDDGTKGNCEEEKGDGGSNGEGKKA